MTWRYADDYCGWAPLPPRCDYREGVGFFYNGAAVSIGFDFGLSVGAFTFVHTRDFCDPHPWRHRVESREVTQVFNRTTVINNFDVDREHRTFINHGIDPRHITEVTHAPIRPIAIHETTARVPRGEQLGRDGRTLTVNRPHFADNPPPSGMRGNPPRTPPVERPGVGSPYQPQGNRGNDNAGQLRRNQPTAPTAGQPQSPRPEVGSPYRPQDNRGNDNAGQQRRYQPSAPATGQPQGPHADTSGLPNRNGPTPPIARPSSPAPAQPPTPNYNSTDNRRYPSPRMLPEQQNPRINPGNSGGRAGAPATPPPQPSAPAQLPQRSYNAPVAPPSTPVRPPEANRYTPPPQPPAPAQPPQRNYSVPATPPSQPAQGNQFRGASAPSSPPAQSQPSQPSQRSGKDKNQNGQ